MKEIIQKVVQDNYNFFYGYALKLATYEVEEAQDLVQEAILNAFDDCPPCDDCPFSGDKDYCPCNKFLNWKENDE